MIRIINNLVSAIVESGSFTPETSGTTTAGVGTYTSHAGTYIKLWKIIFVNGSVIWSAHTGTGDVKIVNLPFTVSGQGGWNSFIRTVNITVTGVLLGIFSANTTDLLLRNVENGANTSLALTTSGQLFFSGFYLTT